MLKTLQAKYIPDLPILEFLLKRRQADGEYALGATSNSEIWGDRRLSLAMPIGTLYKVRRTKMAALARRGLVEEFLTAASGLPKRASSFCIDREYEASLPILRFIKFGDLVKRLRARARRKAFDPDLHHRAAVAQR